MPSLNTLKENFNELKNKWDINISNANIKNLEKINILLNKFIINKELKLLKKKYKNLK
tara:strand:- start:855 stop:1028 length:174 start_codon:yes stop_codon:yes gene_type:complete